MPIRAFRHITKSSSVAVRTRRRLVADDDFIIIETCTDPCGPNTVQGAVSTAAVDDFIQKFIYLITALLVASK